MKREASPPRPDFERHAEDIGFRFARSGGEPYWDESARYVFSLREIEDDLESATQELHALCLALVARVVASEKLLTRLRIPAHAWQLIQESWRRSDPTLYGRFDFSYDGKSPPKLLEYNADTPTSLIETAVAQWHWMEQMIERGHLPKETDQFNSLHEKLIARFGDVSRRCGASGKRLFLACMSSHVEDLNTTEYLADFARSAGFESTVLDMSDIGLEHNLIFKSNFVDRKGRRIEWLFKLYPWEWMLADKFGTAPAMEWVRFLEPPWKTILSNKGMLALLWEMAPDHPNLLPCFFENDPQALSLGDRYARKPLYSREGADTELVDGAMHYRSSADGYGAEGFVRQKLCLLPNFDGRFPALGCWIVGDAPAGMGIREDATPITSNNSRFVPHIIR
jgi:glutathionylspermidine synthase